MIKCCTNLFTGYSESFGSNLWDSEFHLNNSSEFRSNMGDFLTYWPVDKRKTRLEAVKKQFISHTELHHKPVPQNEVPGDFVIFSCILSVHLGL